MQIGLSLPSRRALVVSPVAAWRLALGALVLASAAVRAWAGWFHVTPYYFPDESTYASLSRSLAAGHLPSVRGHVAHFPALLEPLLTAPAWWLGSLEAGYRATQAINAVAISAAAPLVWWGARRLGANRGPALAAAALAVAVPDAGYAGWVLSEPFAYPLFVGAVVAGAAALARPTRRSQVLFAAFALAATFARLQLVVLLPAYFVAALLLRRLRAQRGVAVALVAAAVVVALAIAGFYRGAGLGGFSPGELGRTLYVLALAGGWIVVPAGLLGLAGAWLRPADAEQRAFAAYAGAAGAAVLVEAVLYGDTSIVHERYAFYVLPLLFVGFALHASRGWPWLRAHALLAGAMLLVASTVTVAGWSTSHSLLLLGLLRLQQLTGSAGAGGLAVAVVAGVASLAAIVCAWRRWTAAVAVCALALCVGASVLVTGFDARNARLMKALYLPAGPRWVAGHATLVLGAASRPDVFQQLFWDPELTTLALLPGVPVPDTFTARSTAIARDGRLVGLAGRVVLDESAASLVPVEPLRHAGSWLEASTPQLAAELDGRYGDGWLAPSGRVRLFHGGSLRLTVTAPVATTLTLGARRIRLARGVPTHVTLGCDLRYRFSTSGYIGLRPVSARATFPLWARGAARC